ncbi:DUF3016 domain-containing protein [Aestuariibacter halophilus]|uniref:DUF3016 domain-containing protein n=1 Tax=Fluctibacter halophilus TaxID=226011 RepID=A0ABS8G7A9_9ALTE|nr:DUF3016 domain-containing protein [Aestuariibacter halophilus]MCC2616408.1 DUF3016 domain-containing protein [Aestuariibacter halophilus]
MNLKSNMVITTICALLLGISSTAQAAGTVNVEWQEPSDYRDIKPTNESRKRFQERVLGELESYLVTLGEELPDGQVLSMVVTDLDLAGEVWPASFVGMTGGQDVRIVKELYIPRISFSYTLKDAEGNVLKEGEEKLKDMGFQTHTPSRRMDNDAFKYEKHMLKDWFTKSLMATEQ